MCNGAAARLTLMKNAVGMDRRLVVLDFSPENPGGSGVRRHDDGGSAGGTGRRPLDVVSTVPVDELFDGAPGRPRHPFTGAPIAPADVAFVKIDVEGFEAMAFASARRLLEEGRPPIIKVEMAASLWADADFGGCDLPALLRYLYGLGYAGYMHDLKRPLTLADWTGTILPAHTGGRMTHEQSREGITAIREAFFVHVNAPVPRVLDSDGPTGSPGRAPV